MKKKFNLFLREALQVDLDENEFIGKTISMFAEQFRDYVTNTPLVDKFLQAHKEFDQFSEFLKHEKLEDVLEKLVKEYSPPKKFKPSAVNIMSIHKSKGLQADYVFITGLVEGVLPNKAQGLDTIESQRRRLFVGMTRALKCLFIISQVEWDGKVVHRLDKGQFIYNHKRKVYSGKASLFISEMRN